MRAAARPARLNTCPLPQSGIPVACHQPRSAGSWSAIPPASVTLRRFFAPILILTPSQSSAASYSVGGSRQPFKRFASTWASRRSSSGRSGHPAHNPGAARHNPGGYLGAWADGGSEDNAVRTPIQRRSTVNLSQHSAMRSRLSGVLCYGRRRIFPCPERKSEPVEIPAHLLKRFVETLCRAA